MSRKRTQQSAAPSRQHLVMVVTVPEDFADQQTAFKLGFYHGYERIRGRNPESFIHKPTATAYAAGLMAGCAARATTARQ